MRAVHLKKIGETWHYQRRRPGEFADIEPRPLIRFSLKTKDYSQARALAAQASLKLEQEWADAIQRGISLCSNDAAERYQAAAATVQLHGLSYKTADRLDDRELLDRLRILIEEQHTTPEQKAVLGIIQKPALSLSGAFERFWEHILDERMALSKDQQRVKRNIYLKAIRNFEGAVGSIPLWDLNRDHAMKFRNWWINRVKERGLKPYTANREINSLRRMISVNLDIDGSDQINPFHRIKLKDTKQRQRLPFTGEFIKDTFLKPGHLDGLPVELSILVRLLINTGARPSELIGMELADVDLANEVPFIFVRKNGVRSLKTDHSERQIPLLGVSLEAAQEFYELGGWGKWLGKNMYATTAINKFFRKQELVTDPNQSLYSLRHWFQDQLTKRDVVDRAQAQLMGHKFQRPKYGYGKDLAELREIIVQFAIEAP